MFWICVNQWGAGGCLLSQIFPWRMEAKNSCLSSTGFQHRVFHPTHSGSPDLTSSSWQSVGWDILPANRRLTQFSRRVWQMAVTLCGWQCSESRLRRIRGLSWAAWVPNLEAFYGVSRTGWESAWACECEIKNAVERHTGHGCRLDYYKTQQAVVFIQLWPLDT